MSDTNASALLSMANGTYYVVDDPTRSPNRLWVAYFRHVSRVKYLQQIYDEALYHPYI